MISSFDVIDSFKGDYFFLSNFYPCIIPYMDMYYPSTEHAFQAAKSESIAIRQEICSLKTPGEAKRRGREIIIRPDWDLVKRRVMTEIVLIKFFKKTADNKNLKLDEKLLATSNSILIEGNNWGDRYWGTVDGKGENHLGKILMAVRTILKEAQ